MAYLALSLSGLHERSPRPRYLPRSYIISYRFPNHQHPSPSSPYSLSRLPLDLCPSLRLETPLDAQELPSRLVSRTSRSCSKDVAWTRRVDSPPNGRHGLVDFRSFPPGHGGCSTPHRRILGTSSSSKPSRSRKRSLPLHSRLAIRTRQQATLPRINQLYPLRPHSPPSYYHHFEIVPRQLPYSRFPARPREITQTQISSEG